MDPATIKLAAAILSLFVTIFEARGVFRNAPTQVPQFEQIKKNEKLYFGEGWVDLKSELGDSKEKAKLRALQDLSQNIQVQIHSTFTDVFGESRDKTNQAVNLKIEAYAQSLITSIDQELCVPDYPQKNKLACIVAISKEHYQKFLQETLDGKIKKINFAYESGQIAKKEKRITTALSFFYETQKLLDSDFNGIPVFFGKSGEKKEYHSAVQSEIAQLNNALVIKIKKNKIPYSSKGIPLISPTVEVSLQWNGNPEPIPFFPLKVGFIHGRGRVTPKTKTNSDGVAILEVNFIDPFSNKSVLLIQPDIDNFNNYVDSTTTINQKIEFFKQKSLKIVLKAAPDDSLATLTSISKTVSPLFKNTDFEIIGSQYYLGDESPEESETDADFNLEISFNLSNQQYPKRQLFRSNRKTQVSVINNQDKSVLWECELPESYGVGSSSQIAQGESFNGVQGPLSKTLKSYLRLIK